MGAGDQYLKPKFSVPMGLADDVIWPYDNEPVVKIEDFEICPRCSALAAPERTHPDALDARTMSKLICFGLRRPR